MKRRDPDTGVVTDPVRDLIGGDPPLDAPRVVEPECSDAPGGKHVPDFGSIAYSDGNVFKDMNEGCDKKTEFRAKHAAVLTELQAAFPMPAHCLIDEAVNDANEYGASFASMRQWQIDRMITPIRPSPGIGIPK